MTLYAEWWRWALAIACLVAFGIALGILLAAEILARRAERAVDTSSNEGDTMPIDPETQGQVVAFMGEMSSQILFIEPPPCSNPTCADPNCTHQGELVVVTRLWHPSGLKLSEMDPVLLVGVSRIALGQWLVEQGYTVLREEGTAIKPYEDA